MSQVVDPLTDFRNFLSLVWWHLKLPKPTAVQIDIAQFLATGPRRRMVSAFRGVGKSWITVALVCWLLYNNPQLKIVVVSASKTAADNFTTFVLQLIKDIPQLERLIPRKDQRESKVAFDVGPATPDKQPSVTSLGITSQLAGNRADILIPDDIEVPNNSATVSMRDKLAESVKEFDAIIKPGGQVIFLGTPQSDESIYNRLPERGYTVRIWPALYPDAVQVEKYAGKLAPTVGRLLEQTPELAGKTTEPSRFTDEDLRERLLSYGRAGFSLQFMLNTDLSDMDRYPLRLSDLIVAPMDVEHAPEKHIWAGSPEYSINDLPNVGMSSDRLYSPASIQQNANYLPYTGRVMAVDPSGRGKDETAYAVVFILNSQLYLIDAGGFSSGYADETLQGLADVAKRYQVNKVVVEANFGDGMFLQLLRPVLFKVWPCATEEVKHSTQKEKRIIDTLEPVLSAHRLVVNRALVQKDYNSTRERPTETARHYQLFYQLTRITRDKGSLLVDDRLDALSMAVGYWVEQLSRDVDKAVTCSQDRLLTKELYKFARNVFGNRPNISGWIRRA